MGAAKRNNESHTESVGGGGANDANQTIAEAPNRAAHVAKTDLVVLVAWQQLNLYSESKPPVSTAAAAVQKAKRKRA